MRSARYIPIVLILIPALASPGAAQTSADAERLFFNERVEPHLRAYIHCGLKHFRELGKHTIRRFDDVVNTLPKPCGRHVSDARDVSAGTSKERLRKANEVIDLFVIGVSQMFRRAYDASRKIAIDTSKQGNLQDAWRDCLLGFATETSTTNDERASVIVRGAFAYCEQHENALYSHLTASGGFLADFVRDEVFPEIRTHYEAETIALILKLRAMPANPDEQPEPSESPRERPT